jgi:hypothetical protein
MVFRREILLITAPDSSPLGTKRGMNFHAISGGRKGSLKP